ncbi:alpha/beta fold hydrolase [Nocardioides panaciterrulae]|nr:alpha/beta hydrolase [Nocardioides panaciterrulae]
MTRSYEPFDVAVAGGDLHAGRWGRGSDGPVVLALHGVTSNHLAWSAVARHSSYDVVAPDLRGRGRSNGLAGPAGMHAHAADLALLLDHLEVEQAVVVGHSMGGFVATTFAAEHPDRVASVLLVDGGLSLPPMPPGLSPEETVAAVIGPAAQRLSMTFADTEAYLDFWRRHPALGPDLSQEVADYFAYDLVGDPPECRSSVTVESVREDSIDLLDTAAIDARVGKLATGTVFLRAQNGMMGEPGGLYPAELARQHASSYPNLDVRDVAGVNHYTVVMGDQGAAVVAAAIEESAGGAR